jgi:hypothetical protein
VEWEERTLIPSDVPNPGQIAVIVADRLHEYVIEERCNIWPTCPEHGTHPLWLYPGDTPDTMWTCVVTKTAFAQLGQLKERWLGNRT